MAQYIIQHGDASVGNVYIPPTYTTQFAYVFSRGAALWACLEAYDENTGDPTLFEKIAICKSTDSGVTWTVMNDAGSPHLSLGAPGFPVAFDLRFNNIDPSSKAAITALYVDESLGIHLIDFDFTAGTYGAPYGTLAWTTMNDYYFSSLPDGSLIFVYYRPSAITSYYRTYSGGWGSEHTLGAGQVLGLTVDGSGNAHIMVDDGSGLRYYRISSGAIVEGPTSIGTPYGSGNNLALVDGNLVFASISSSTEIDVFTGSPASAPTWTVESVAVSTVNQAPYSAWFAKINPPYFVAFELQGFDGTDRVDYTIYSSMASVIGYTLHWAAADHSAIWRSVKTAGAWGAEASVLTPSIAVSFGILSVIARGAAAGPIIGSRYRPIFFP